jgi:hypothetical protein
MNKFILYRVTSRLNQKLRLDNFSKLDCLDSLINNFPDYKLICLADNCDPSFIQILEKKHFYKLIQTSLGNAASFNFLINHELPFFEDDDLIYFAEDDYLYRDGACAVLEEGLQYFDYVTLYDHPDKYGVSQGDLNLFVPKGDLSEHTQIVKGEKSLWRTTNSTTMTFGCFVRTIRKDLMIWNFFTRMTSVPRDFYIWILLTCPRKLFISPRIKLSTILFLSNLLYVLRGRRLLGVTVSSFSAHLEVSMVPDNFEIYISDAGNKSN